MLWEGAQGITFLKYARIFIYRLSLFQGLKTWFIAIILLHISSWMMFTKIKKCLVLPGFRSVALQIPQIQVYWSNWESFTLSFKVTGFIVLYRNVCWLPKDIGSFCNLSLYIFRTQNHISVVLHLSRNLGSSPHKWWANLKSPHKVTLSLNL